MSHEKCRRQLSHHARICIPPWKIWRWWHSTASSHYIILRLVLVFIDNNNSSNNSPGRRIRLSHETIFIRLLRRNRQEVRCLLSSNNHTRSKEQHAILVRCSQHVAGIDANIALGYDACFQHNTARGRKGGRDMDLPFPANVL